MQPSSPLRLQIDQLDDSLRNGGELIAVEIQPKAKKQMYEK